MNVIKTIQDTYKKPQVVDVRTGDTVRVHQKIKEGNKERIQVFEGMVIRVKQTGSLTSSILVRRIASGVGVEKSFLLHSPNVVKVEVTKRTKVRRNYLTYMRARTGKSARLTAVDFDRQQVNTVAKTTSSDQEAVEAQTADAADTIEAPETVAAAQ